MKIIKSFDNNTKGDILNIRFEFITGKEIKIDLNLQEWCELEKALLYGQYQPYKREINGDVISYHFAKSEYIISWYKNKYEDEVW